MFVCLFCGCFLFGLEVTEFCNQQLMLQDGWAWSSWGSLWADQVGNGLLTKLQRAVAASALLFLLQLLSPPPPSSLLGFISLFYLPLFYLSFYLSPCASLFRGVPLCALAVSCPCLSCWEPVSSCLPVWDSSCKLAEGQKHHQPGTPSCNSCSATEHACVSWRCFSDKVLLDLGRGRKEESEGHSRELALLWLRLTENLISPFPLPYALYIS